MKKVYEKTRYDNIYRHITNNNYFIRHNGTTISKINNEKIYDIKVARDYKAKLELNIKKAEKTSNSYSFKDLWKEYVNYSENVAKLAYNTIKKKRLFYNCFLKELDSYKVNEITKNDIIDFMNGLTTTDKQKNEILKHLKAFITWCDVEKDIITVNPVKGIKNIKVPKVEMKYWSIKEFTKFMSYINSQHNDKAYRIKMLVLLELHLGDRIGETRALTWSSINEEKSTIRISHSINYDDKSKELLSSTKTYSSDRVVDVSPKLIIELKRYKEYLIKQQININDLIFFNYSINKPFSDVALRKLFYKYCNLAGVSKIRMYDLRHTYVALMMNEGWALYHISKRIGHCNYSTTVDKYGHLENNIRKKIARTTDKYI